MMCEGFGIVHKCVKHAEKQTELPWHILHFHSVT